MLKKYLKSMSKNASGRFSGVFLMVVIVTLMSISLISAFEIDNIKDVKETKGLAGYNDIEIKNFWGVGETLWTGTLNSNTPNCSYNCEAIQTIILHEKGFLVSNVIFERIFDDDSREEVNIADYKIYIKVNEKEVLVNDYNVQCHQEPVGNGSFYKVCEEVIIGNYTEEVFDWEEYQLGFELDAGTYEVKLIGKKNPKWIVDWKYVYGSGFGNIKLDEWAVWGGGNNSLLTNLITYYNFNETTGATLNDRVNGTLDGTLINMENGDWMPGIIANGLDFGGTDEYVNKTFNPVIFDLMSISVWVNTSDAGQGAIFEYDNTLVNPTDTSLGINGAGNQVRANKAVFSMGNNATTTISSITNVNDGAWHHIVVTTNGSNASIYVDGVRENSTEYLGTIWESVNFSIGVKSDANNERFYVGMLDEMGFWSRELNVTDIEDLYNSELGFEYNFTESAGIVNLESPINYFNSSLNEVEFNANATITGATLDNASLWHNESGTFELNISNTTVSGNSDNVTFNQTFSDGGYIWNIQFCDSDGDCGFGDVNRTLTVDTTAPSITINLPRTIEDYGETDGNETLNWTITESNLDSIWYEYNGTNTTIYGAVNETNFTLATSPFNITIWVNDTFGNTNSSTRTWSYYLFESTSTYSATAYETTEEDFELEVEGQSGLTTISASLFYNGTEYSSDVTNPSGNTYNASNTIEIPLIEVDGTKEFYWNFDFTLTNGSSKSVNSSAKTQIINRTWLTECNATYTVDFINFSVYEAINPFPSVNATMKITWDWYLNTSDGTVRRNESWENISEVKNTWSFCGSPVDRALVVDAIIEYDGTGWAKNFYYLNAFTLSNATTNISLYLLNDSDATLAVLRVLDGSQKPLENYGIEIQAYDIGTGLFNTVAMAETSFAGEDLVYLNWYDTQYKFIITDTNNTEVLNTEPYKISETPQIFEIITDITYDFDKFEDITYSLTFDNTTNIFTLTYSKPTDVDSACLRVIKRNVTLDTEVCLTCLTATSATITCDVTSSGNGTYIAAFYGTGSLKLIDAISAMVNLQNQIFDALGNVDATGIAIIFAGIVTAMFFVSPVLGIVGVLLGMIGAVALGFQPLEGDFYFAYAGIILMGGAIAWLIKK